MRMRMWVHNTYTDAGNTRSAGPCLWAKPPWRCSGAANMSPQAAGQSLHPPLVFDCIEAYAPGFKASVIGRDILTPPDLERIFGLPGGVGTMQAQL